MVLSLHRKGRIRLLALRPRFYIRLPGLRNNERKHRVHLQYVAVASLPESYADRLTELFPRRFDRLRLFALDAHDLALSKLARNSPVDRDDVAQLARSVPLKAEILRTRYQSELRAIIIGDVARHDRTLEMWIDSYVL